MKKNVVRLVIWNVSIAMLLAEVLLRIFDPLGVSYFPETERYFASMVGNKPYAYIHRPGSYEYQGVGVAINSQGFRGPEIPLHGLPDTKRVLLLGDSIVFGWGVDQEHIFPSVLQRLADAQGLHLEFVAAGVGSWNTRTEFEFLRASESAFDANVIALFVVSNDLEPHLDGHTEVPKELLGKNKWERDQLPRFLVQGMRAAISQSYLLMQVRFLLRTRQVRRGQEELGGATPEWRDAQLALDGIIKFCQRRNIRLIVYLFGSQADVIEKPVLSRYKQYLELRQVTWRALPAALFEDRALQNSIVDPHPNSRGHELIADSVLQDLRGM